AAQLDEPVRLDPTQLLERLAQIAPAIQTFAAERLSAPKHETLESAKEELMRAAAKLKALFLDEDARAAANEQRKGDADFEQELALAGELNERMRLERHGLGPDGHPLRHVGEIPSAKIEPKKH
ncbi:MAG: hypothetical protein ACREJX_05590, partial [Polyangiaceae bacterium]